MNGDDGDDDYPRAASCVCMLCVCAPKHARKRLKTSAHKNCCRLTRLLLFLPSTQKKMVATTAGDGDGDGGASTPLSLSRRRCEKSLARAALCARALLAEWERHDKTHAHTHTPLYQRRPQVAGVRALSGASLSSSLSFLAAASCNPLPLSPPRRQIMMMQAVEGDVEAAEAPTPEDQRSRALLAYFAPGGLILSSPSRAHFLSATASPSPLAPFLGCCTRLLLSLPTPTHNQCSRFE